MNDIGRFYFQCSSWRLAIILRNIIANLGGIRVYRSLTPAIPPYTKVGRRIPSVLPQASGRLFRRILRLGVMAPGVPASLPTLDIK